MVIRGNTRGNGRQLAYYLLDMADNIQIEIWEADGWNNLNKTEFSNLLYDMSVTAELTKSKKGLYHAQINPAIGEDKELTMEEWMQCADILSKELGLENQRRAIVFHEKKGRTINQENRRHIHVVWERYDHDKGIMVSNSFSRYAQNRARMEMERILDLQKTPYRNAHKPELKATLTELWQQTKTAKEFMREVDKAGYMLAEGILRHPFMVVDANGRTYDLVRQLKGVRIKEVRERMRGEKLIHEKKAIEIMRARGEQDKGEKGKGKQKEEAKPKAANTSREDNQKDITKDNRTAENIAREFAGSRNDMLQPEPEQIRFNKAKEDYDTAANEITTDKQQTAKETARNFMDNKQDTQRELTPEEAKEQERERIKKEFKEQLRKDREQRDRNRDKDKGRDYDG